MLDHARHHRELAGREQRAMRVAMTHRHDARRDERDERRVRLITRKRLGPKSAYASIAAKDAYRLFTAGSPVASAYAMPAGTSTALSESPAMKSCTSQRDSYARSTASPLIQRSGFVIACVGIGAGVGSCLV